MRKQRPRPHLANEFPPPRDSRGTCQPPMTYLDAHQAAEFLRLSPRTLEKQRVVGGGPQFMKLGRRVIYRLEDLEAWANDRTCRSTADATYNELR